MVKHKNLDGRWIGSFAYPGNRETGLFHLRLAQNYHGVLSGLAEEKRLLGHRLKTHFKGMHDGVNVLLEKTYLLRPGEELLVTYIGKANPERTEIRGSWHLLQQDCPRWSGPFVINRIEARRPGQGSGLFAQPVI